MIVVDGRAHAIGAELAARMLVNRRRGAADRHHAY